MAENGKNGNGNGVKLGGMKLPIAVIGVIVVQAFGIIWYVANLDSTVKNMQQNVAQMQEAATTVDVAVMQTDIVNLKDKIIMMDEMHGEKFDPQPLENDIDNLDEELHVAIDKLEDKLDVGLRALETQVDFRLMDVGAKIDQNHEETRNEVNHVANALGEVRSYVDMRAGEADNSARSRVENLQADIEWRLEEAEHDVEFKFQEFNNHLDSTRIGLEEGIDHIRTFAVPEERLNSRVQELDGFINYKVDEIRNELEDLRRGLEDQYSERFMHMENTLSNQLPDLEEKFYGLEGQVNYNWQDLDFQIEELADVQDHDRQNVTPGFADLALAARDSLDHVQERIDYAEEALEERIRYIEQIVAVVENEMRTIMADHDKFNDILREMGREGYGDDREYGNYDAQQSSLKGSPVSQVEEPALTPKQIERQAERQAERDAKKAAEEKAKKQAERQAQRKAEREAAKQQS